jgi:hypothetical protein
MTLPSSHSESESPVSKIEANLSYGGYGGSFSRPGPHIHRYVAFLRRKWWIPTLCLLFFVGLGLGYVYYWPVNYVSVGHMWAAGKVGLQLRKAPPTAKKAKHLLAHRSNFSRAILY